jgi:hypothetical protein
MIVMFARYKMAVTYHILEVLLCERALVNRNLRPQPLPAYHGLAKCLAKGLANVLTLTQKLLVYSFEKRY